MTSQIAEPGRVVETKIDSDSLMAYLVNTPELKVFRLAIPAGENVPSHKTHGVVVVHCVTGRVIFTALDTTRELAAGQLLYLEPETQHSLEAIDDATLVVSVFLKSDSQEQRPKTNGNGQA